MVQELERRLRLLLVVDVFTPTRTSAAVQMHDLAAALSQMGHTCTVVTPDHRINDSFVLEQRHGFSVLRVRSTALKQIGLIRRALREIGLSTRMWKGFRNSPVAQERYDGVVFYSPTIFLGRFISKLKNLYRCPAYLILRDVFPDWAADLGEMRKGPHYWFFKGVAKYQYHVADAIGIESEGNRKYFQDSQRVELLDNWIAIQSDGDAHYLLPPELAAKTILVYAGNMGVAQDMDNLLRLARRLAARPDVRLLLVGSGTERSRLEREVRSADLSNVVFLPEMAPAELRALLRQCHIGVLSLDKRLKTHNVPGKLLSYMEAGLPVLGSVNPGNEVKRLVDEAGVGLVSWNGDDDAFADAAMRMIDEQNERHQMGLAARDICQGRFSSRRAASQILERLTFQAAFGVDPQGDVAEEAIDAVRP